MDASPEATSAAIPDIAGFVANIRAQTAQLLATEGQCLDLLESTLAAQRDERAGDRAQHEELLAAGRAQLEQQTAALAAQRAELESAQAEFAARQQDWQREQEAAVAARQAEQARLHGRQEELAARELEIEKAARQSQRAIAIAEEELAAEREQFARQRERLEAQRGELDQERERLADWDSQTKAQRRRIAREFQAQRAEHVAALQRQRAELSALSGGDADWQQRLAAASAEHERLRGELAEQRATASQRGVEVAVLEQRIAEQAGDLAELRVAHDRLSQELALRPAASQHSSQAWAELQGERDRLAAELAEARQQLADAAAQPIDAEREEELRRRFEMAVEDVRELKRRNADLEERLEQVRSGHPMSAPESGMDWESQKRRLLAALEADEDDEEESPAQAQERLTIEGTVRITDEIVARKDREIAELQQLLSAQSSNIGNVAVGAAALAELLDKDEIVIAERDKLAQLQNEWREKLRHAEVELSVERAKLARERVELDEKLREIRAAQVHAPDAGQAATPGAKPARGRWLARLGLKDN